MNMAFCKWLSILCGCSPLVALWTFCVLLSVPAMAQTPFSPGRAPAPAAQPTPASVQKQDEEQPSTPETVDVRPGAGDEEIAARLQRILTATEWFEQPVVRVDEGVAFLTGRTETDTLKKWAGDLARNTEDVVAVVNRIEVENPPLWDLAPAMKSLNNLWRGFVRTFPLWVFGVLVLLMAWFAGRVTTRLTRRGLARRDRSTQLLREVMARAAGAGVFLLGLYLVLLVMGLARLAVTVLGGTGLIGLIIGIAFRDITENFLASIFLSLQRPFRSGDLIKVDEVTGIVQRLTVRTTVLMTPEGNHVQIPNSTVYKSNIRNYTSNPNRQESFIVGIGYEVAITEAQEIALEVLRKHPAVLKDPEPWVLVDNLGPATVNLKVYFWLDGTKHSFLKVRSSVIRLVKRAFQEHDISMPDEAREVVVNGEIPIALRVDGDSGVVEKALAESGSTEPKKVRRTALPGQGASRRARGESEAISTEAEAGLSSDAETVQQQADRSRVPEPGENLLD